MENEIVEEIASMQEFEKFVASGTAVIDFFTDWCMPCVMLSPILEELAKKHKKIRFGKVNAEEMPELAAKFKIMSVPTLVIFKEGKEADRITGAVSAETIEEKLKEIEA